MISYISYRTTRSRASRHARHRITATYTMEQINRFQNPETIAHIEKLFATMRAEPEYDKIEQRVSDNGIHDAFNNLYYKILSYADEHDPDTRKKEERIIARVAEILWSHPAYALSDRNVIGDFLVTLLAFPEAPSDDYAQRVMDAYVQAQPVIERN